MDQIFSQELDDEVVGMITELRRLYQNRKLNPSKKQRGGDRVKKRYVTGLNEVKKHLLAE